MIQFIVSNIVEIIAAILGLLFLYLEIKENKWLWLVGLLTSAMYIYIFFVAKLYADMSLQIYYVIISVYGWIMWTKTNKGKQAKNELLISRLSVSMLIKLIAVTFAVYLVIAYVLVNYTDGSIPYWDALTTSMGIVATWMLAKKILEQWLVWVLANAISLCLYIYKGLYPTVVLFLFYTILAVVGYYKWKKTLTSTYYKN